MHMLNWNSLKEPISNGKLNFSYANIVNKALLSQQAWEIRIGQSK